MAAAAVAVPAALPSGAAAHHQCVPSETFLTVDQTNQAQLVDAGHRLPIFNSCGPHRVAVTYVEHDGTRDEAALQSGDVSVTHTQPEREPGTSNSSPAAPAQDARPARRAKRSCRKARRAKTRAQRRAQRRAAQRCRRR
jgi:hypothetical protein